MTKYEAKSEENLDQFIEASSDLKSSDDVRTRILKNIESQRQKTIEANESEKIPWLWIFAMIILWSIASISSNTPNTPSKRPKLPVSKGLNEFWQDNQNSSSGQYFKI